MNRCIVRVETIGLRGILYERRNEGPNQCLVETISDGRNLIVNEDFDSNSQQMIHPPERSGLRMAWKSFDPEEY